LQVEPIGTLLRAWHPLPSGARVRPQVSRLRNLLADCRTVGEADQCSGWQPTKAQGRRVTAQGVIGGDRLCDH